MNLLDETKAAVFRELLKLLHAHRHSVDNLSVSDSSGLLLSYRIQNTSKISLSRRGNCYTYFNSHE